MENNLNRRAEVVRAMETMIRTVNCEDFIDTWLMVGVADGDIKADTTNEEIIEMGYTDDSTFRELLTVFSKVMNRAFGNGGLYCDGIVSKERVTRWE